MKGKIQLAALLCAPLLLLSACQSNPTIQSTTEQAVTANATQTNQSNRFAGRYLLAISDADMVASAYVDGKLNHSPDAKDTLTVISLPTSGQNPTIAQLNVSNSVASWPNVIAVSSDGKSISA